MTIRWPTDLRTAAAWMGATVGLLVLAGAVFMLSGLYSVAASRGHFLLTSKLLEIGMHRSVATHTLLVGAPPPLDNPQLVRLGAGHFHGGCAPCHGAPGERSSPIVDRMLPPPPPLPLASEIWTDKELFWIVRNGIKYTGMPAWVSLQRDDEVWAVVAFLRALPAMTTADYRSITRSWDGAQDRGASEPALFDEASAISACARCHGSESLAPVSTMVPVIAGQSRAYLERAIRLYRDGRRESGFMQPAAANLDDDVISRLAEYYAGLSWVQAKASSAPQEQILRGQEIATLGVPSKGIPACLVCHAGSTPMFPRLAGQHAPYIATQLRLWQRGLRQASTYGAIMAPIAERLSQEQIDDVAAFFESAGTATKSPGRNGAGGAP